MRRPVVWLVVAAALAAAACVGPSVNELNRSADALTVPADWEYVGEEVADRPCRDPIETCPKVDRTYRVPGATNFATVITQMLEDTDYEVDEAPSHGCGPNPEPGCSAGAHQDNVSLWAVVVESAADSYTVTVRAAEYVGP